MAFLQPWMLWALPAVLLPVLIHLLNRLRYRTVQWAAMLFLLKANRAATRRAKVRQYLLLACRCLVLLFLIWAMARPLVGGWIGAAAGGAPEAVLLLLDRSASMEARGSGEGAETKRAHALALFSEAAKSSAGSRFVLIENVLRQPLEIADASALASLQMAEATDTAADLPTMLRAALDYLSANKPGSAEVWIASDLQASNWRPDSTEWQDLAARFAGLPQGVRMRILDLSGASGHNLSVAVKAADLRVRDAKSGKAQLGLALEWRSAEGTASGAIPLLLTREGAKSQIDVTLSSPLQRQTLKFDLPKIEAGWGKAELPADDLASDNAAYFAYAPPVPLHSVIIAEGAAQRLRLAAAPDPTRTDRTAEILSSAHAETAKWKDAALAIWAASAPSEAAAKALSVWLESGGVLLVFPPGGEGGPGPLGLAWAAVENAPPSAPLRVSAWDELDGPLARTDSGASLPLAQLEVRQRQVPAAGETAHVYATFADGRPFLVGRKVGEGYVFACATQPETEWSTLGNGFVLLPMTQRLLALGGQRLSPPALAVAGEWKPSNLAETWSPVETERRRDWRWHAGVYASGDRRVALNRPETEDLPERVDPARLAELLRGVKLTVMTGALALRADRLQSELWPAMLLVAMLLMCAEMLLATSKAMLPRKPAARATPMSRPTTQEVGA